MATNDQKTPFGLSINRAARARAAEAISQLGKALPCHVVSVVGSIVQVAFDVVAVPGQTPVTLNNVTIPVVGWEYARAPIQVGDKGMTVSADVYLGGVSGLGGGIAKLTTPGNLTALAFLPLGNTGFSAQDGTKYVIYGPGGAQMKDTTGAAIVDLTPTSINAVVGSTVIAMTTSQITLTAGGVTMTISSAGVMIDGTLFETHVHPVGSTNTGAPVVGS